MSSTFIIPSRLYGLAISSAVFAAAVMAHQVSGGCGAAEPQPDDDYQTVRERRWDPLLQKAGATRRGLILDARISKRSAVVGEEVNITLSIRNISSTTVRFLNDAAYAPEVWVRDERGLPAKLGQKGIQFYGAPLSNAGLSGSTFGEEVRAGCAVGYDFPLSEYFVLDRPGTYTILPSKLIELPVDDRVWLVAKPLVVEVQSSVPKDGGKIKIADPTIRTRPAGPNEPSDKEWSALANKGGNRVDGCVLEASDSPLFPGQAHLIVSLICEKYVGASFTHMPKAGLAATDYRVLIRDGAGHPVARLQPAPKSAPTDSGDSKDKDVRRMPGNAIGAMLPLGDYFDLKKSGEYWVLVSLPQSNENDPKWVAEPVKVRVGTRPAAPKK